ncbi:MAG: DUF423 domain-containing protein [Anaerolineae bacterium]|nr:DUF423 domain-containing protein [Anaerolineae bacterium]
MRNAAAVERIFTVIAGVLGVLAVALGAFGSHGLAAHFAARPDLQGPYETANRYHMAHALALLAVAWAATRWSSPLLPWAGWLFVAGVILFSGSLYVLSLTGLRWLGAVAPLGGMAFVAGWALLALAAWRG